MAKVTITLESDDGDDNVQVTTSFQPGLDEKHASHRLAAVMLTYATEVGDMTEDLRRVDN